VNYLLGLERGHPSIVCVDTHASVVGPHVEIFALGVGTVGFWIYPTPVVWRHGRRPNPPCLVHGIKAALARLPSGLVFCITVRGRRKRRITF